MTIGYPLRTLLAAALVAVALSVAAAWAASAASAHNLRPGRAGATRAALGALARPLLREINRARTAAGVAPVRLDPRLALAARVHTRRIARLGALSHASNDGSGPAERVAVAGFRGGFVGEDLAVAADPREVVRLWLNSPRHREILLSPRSRAVGLGLAAGAFAQATEVYVTADFGA